MLQKWWRRGFGPTNPRTESSIVSEKTKPKWREVQLQVRFLVREYDDEFDVSRNVREMTLKDIAYHITDHNGEFLGIWLITSEKTLGLQDAIGVAEELGNDGSWVCDNICERCEMEDFECSCDED